ncbi:uncharacterized protein (DUF1684 family) [Kineosphaera limosa]|uniref:DUF559 domain-containing protein n=1 Tax=Kineosphaera limosa NBRC 100340 TaxID=1184609 RepID=K6WQN5_9MICO|nr:hypothetical protein [Kineosphaera limosa]NYE01925.1 uncharacterized protein (DUF1684 family) [Kineosphaera limosa]GAB96151.1 hypothetical protein KILIM_032_00370 [Kineosphaera limosa NBRC 100340]
MWTTLVTSSIFADVALRIVIEGDSYAWHATRSAFAADCDRYTGLIAADWLVLRPTWRAVTKTPQRLRRQFSDVVALREGQRDRAAGVVCPHCLRDAA